MNQEPSALPSFDADQPAPDPEVTIDSAKRAPRKLLTVQQKIDRIVAPQRANVEKLQKRVEARKAELSVLEKDLGKAQRELERVERMAEASVSEEG